MVVVVVVDVVVGVVVVVVVVVDVDVDVVLVVDVEVVLVVVDVLVVDVVLVVDCGTEDESRDPLELFDPSPPALSLAFSPCHTLELTVVDVEAELVLVVVGVVVLEVLVETGTRVDVVAWAAGVDCRVCVEISRGGAKVVVVNSGASPPTLKLHFQDHFPSLPCTYAPRHRFCCAHAGIATPGGDAAQSTQTFVFGGDLAITFDGLCGTPAAVAAAAAAASACARSCCLRC